MRSLTFQGVSWHDDPNPVEGDLRRLQQEYGFHELDIEDCLSENERPKIEEYDKYLFLVFHIPYRVQRTGRITKEEVNIFLGQNFVVTLHHGNIPILDQLWNDLETSHQKREDYLEHGTGFFLYELMHHFFDGGFPLVDSITKEIRHLEEALFDTDVETDLLRDIMVMKRNIISMRSTLLPQRTLIATLEHKNKKFVPEDLGLYFDNILDAIERQWSLLDKAKEMIDALQDTHESLLSHRTNAIIRVLTIFSVTMLPLMFVVSFYGMNIELPLANSPNAFLIISAFMGVLLMGMLWYFAKKRWL